MPISLRTVAAPPVELARDLSLGTSQSRPNPVLRSVEELRDSQQRLRNLFDASPDIIAVRRLRDGRFTYVNLEFTRVHGYTRAEALTKRVDELHLWVDDARREQFSQKLLAEGTVRNWEENNA